MSCSDYPTAQTAKTFKLDAETTNEVVTLEQDRTSAASDGKTKKTFWGIENDATNQYNSIQKRADQQYAEVASKYAIRNVGNYADDPLISEYFEFVQFGDLIYFAINPPYQVDSATYPDPSGDSSNLRLGQATDASLVTSTGSTTPRTLADRFADVVNVKDFGATGDGSTDDATAINACFQSMTNGGTVYFPDGTYFIGTNITPLSNTTIQGGGNSIIKLKDHTVSVLFEFTSNNKMFNMKVDGNYLEWLVPDNFVVTIRNCFNFFMEYCEVYNGYGVGIGIGRGNHPASERVTIQNCIVHDMGSDTHPVITNPWANGIANTVGKDVKILNNYIYDVWGTGGINCEGLVNENILIADNTIFDIHEDCAGIKLYAGGAGQPPKNVVIRNNQLYNINDTLASPVQKEPAIWVSSGEDVQIIGNTISNCIYNDAISANPSGTLIIDSNIIKNCPEGRIRAAASQHIKVTNNIIDCPDGAVYTNEAPLWVESNTTPADGTCIVKGNSITNSPLNAAWINLGATAGEFTSNSFFNCHKDVGNPTVLVGTKDNWRNSIIGNNIISDDIGDVTSRLTYFYSLSGNKLGGGILLPDVWDMADDTHEGIKYDLGSNTEFFQSDLAAFSAAPSAGYNQRGDIVYNISPDVGDPIGWVCRLSGAPGTWNGFGEIMA
ncbi:putative right-handed parallel beta-helix repeat-containing protein [Vibrio phage 242E40-1]|nr:putative right-handed parallel beta-helix repeat-containing protein [Vibrio phage 242E40-1]